MVYPQNLRRTSTQRSDTEPLSIPQGEVGSFVSRGNTFPMATTTPPPSLSQCSYRPAPPPRSESLSRQPSRRENAIPVNPLRQPSYTSPAFYIAPKPLSRRETASTAISESPQESSSKNYTTIPPSSSTSQPPKKPFVQPINNTSTFSLTSSISPSPTTNQIHRQNSAPLQQTTYMKMLLGLDKISKVDNLLIAFSNWIILAGFLIFPATYVSLSKAQSSTTLENSQAAQTAIKAIQNVPLLVIAYACCGIGCVGIFWLWWKLRMNYVWLCNKIFLTVCLNSLAGLISTLISVYGSKGGHWSLQAKITGIVTGGVCGVSTVLYLLYNFVFLAKVRERHDREMDKLERLGVV